MALFAGAELSAFTPNCAKITFEKIRMK